MKQQPKQLEVPGLGEDICAILARARRFKQYCDAVADALAGRCAFCDLNRDRNRVCLENDLVLAWPSTSPEAHTSRHFMIVPRRHVKNINELTPEEVLALHNAHCVLMETYDITSCGLLCRNGDATRSAGTIQHLHFHLMVPDGTGRVESPFFKGRYKERQGHLRAMVFEKLRTGTKFEDLTPAEQKRVRNCLN